MPLAAPLTFNCGIRVRAYGLASSPNVNAAQVFLSWILSRDGQSQFQKLTRENSLRVYIGKDGVNPCYILDPK